VRLHLVDGTYELYRAHYSKRPDRPKKATVGLASSLLSLLDDAKEAVTHVAVAFDAQRLGALVQRDRGVGTIGKKHHDLAGAILRLENRAEEMVGAEIRHPGQRAAHDVTALDPASP